MIDILAGRCSEHGWLTSEEIAAEYCMRCEHPESFEPDDFDETDPGDEDEWPGAECGRWDQSAPGGMGPCRLAGTEFCDFECPYR